MRIAKGQKSVLLVARSRRLRLFVPIVLLLTVSLLEKRHILLYFKPKSRSERSYMGFLSNWIIAQQLIWDMKSLILYSWCILYRKYWNVWTHEYLQFFNNAGKINKMSLLVVLHKIPGISALGEKNSLNFLREIKEACKMFCELWFHS